MNSYYSRRKGGRRQKLPGMVAILNKPFKRVIKELSLGKRFPSFKALIDLMFCKNRNPRKKLSVLSGIGIKFASSIS